MVSVCYHWGAGMKQQQLWEPSFQTMSDTSTECYIICFTEAERGDHQGAGSAPCFSVLPGFGHASATCGLLWPLPAGKSSQKTVCQWGELWNSLGAALFSLLWYGCSARGGWVPPGQEAPNTGLIITVGMGSCIIPLFTTPNGIKADIHIPSSSLSFWRKQKKKKFKSKHFFSK